MAHRLVVRCLLLLSCVSTATSLASSARADKPLSAGNAEAATLFGRGVAAFEAKRFAEALPLFEKSYALEEALGTLLYLADCHAQLGHTATAWASFRKAAAEAARLGDKRANAASEQVRALEKSLAYLTLELAPNGPADQEIRLDGRVVPPSEVGNATPVDQGPHTVELSAQGFTPQRREINVSAGARTVVKLVALQAIQSGAVVPAKSPTASAKPPASSAPPASDGPWRMGGYVAGIGGLALAGVGTFVTVSKTGQANDAARARTLGSRATYDDAKSGRTVGFVLIGAGTVIAAAGITVLVLHPTPTTALRVGPTPDARGLVVTGAF